MVGVGIQALVFLRVVMVLVSWIGSLGMVTLLWLLCCCPWVSLSALCSDRKVLTWASALLLLWLPCSLFFSMGVDLFDGSLSFYSDRYRYGYGLWLGSLCLCVCMGTCLDMHVWM